MTETIDWRRYLNVFVRHWRLITALTIGAAVVALVVSLLIPPTYEATALVVTTKPLYQLQFDPRIENLAINDQTSPNKALPQLATSDGVLQPLFNQFRGQLARSDMTLTNFKEGLTARAGADPSIIQLLARDKNPQLASNIANTWAVNYVTYTNELYQQREAGVTFFETQANEAQLKLTSAEQALVDFQSRNQGSIIDSQLQADTQDLASALQTRATLKTITANAGLLQARLAKQPANAVSNLTDNLSSMLLQIHSLNVNAVVPFQIQLTDSTAVAGKTVGEQQAFLAGLLDSLKIRAQQIEGQINALQPEILSLQQKLQSVTTEADRLTRARDVARDTYTTLTKKVTEAQITAQDTSGQIRVASLAVVPTEVIAPRKAAITLLGALVGLVIGVVIASLNGLRTPELVGSIEQPSTARVSS